MSLGIILFVILALLLFYNIFKLYWYSHPKFPRGYVGLPFVGFLVHFVTGQNYTRRLLDMKKKYGDICSVQMGSFKCVWLNDFEAIREAWASPAFSGRPLIPGILERTRGFRGGIIFNDGENFMEQQKFVLRTLKECGLFGAKDMEKFILDEALELVAKLKVTAGQPVTTCHRFNMAALNALWTIISGIRYAHDDPELLKLTSTLDRNMELNDGAKIAFFMPWLAKFFFFGWKKYLGESRAIFEFWEKVVKERVHRFESLEVAADGQDSIKKVPGNFIDAYIQHIHETNDPKSSFFADVGVKSLAVTLQDLFIAGTETTSTTLSWAFLYLASFSHVQKILIQEIDTVLGSGHQRIRPKWTDRARLPFLEAFLLETMRFGTLAPLGMVHRTVKNVQFRGYFIPKHTIVQSNVTAVHLDQKLWGDPENFRPNRFLSEDGRTVQSFKYFLAFGHGKRKCIGEKIARLELFLFVSIIMQEFQVKLDPDQPKPSLEPKIGVSAIPQAHKLIFEHRQ